MDALQQILFYRELGLELAEIGAIMRSPDYDRKNSREAHIGVVQMYTADERFTTYYDEKTPGCAAFLKAAVEKYA